MSSTLPARDGVIDGQTLIDIGFPYSVVDPRLLDAFVQDWMRGNHIVAITLSATDHDLVIR